MVVLLVMASCLSFLVSCEIHSSGIKTEHWFLGMGSRRWEV